MSNLFDEEQYQELKERLDKLSPDSERQWGKMTVAQMLAHCADVLEVAVGKLTLPQNFLGKTIGKWIKGSWVSGDKPFYHNSPTDKNVIKTDDCNFDAEKSRLSKLVTLFHQEGKQLAIDKTHPFFGKLSTEEWSNLSARHLDHHFRQFGG